MLARMKMQYSNNPRKEYYLHWSNIYMTHILNPLYPTLPNTLMSKNWIPMAKDFSSEAIDLKEEKPLSSQKYNSLGVDVCVVGVYFVDVCFWVFVVWAFVWWVFVLWAFVWWVFEWWVFILWVFVLSVFCAVCVCVCCVSWASVLWVFCVVGVDAGSVLT